MTMTKKDLPPCGIYRTTTALGDVPAGRLVYFHNHGEPGPGIYTPEKWISNRAEFQARGFTLPTPYDLMAATLEALPAEGFYKVRESFVCCEKKCRTFEPGLFVQLGYDGAGEAILFTPELSAHGILLPERGSLVTRTNLAKLEPLLVAEVPKGSSQAAGTNQKHLH